MEHQERLKLARKTAGFAFASEAARALDVKLPTYLSHENGSRDFRKDSDLTEKYARRFGVTPEWLMYERGSGPKASAVKEADPGAPEIVAKDVLVGPGDLPVFGSTEGGEGNIIITTDVVDVVRRPAPLLHVRDGYGLIITGTSMVPAFRPGDIALVHPHLPPRSEDGVVLYNQDRDRSSIKEYRAATETEWRLKRYQPKEQEFLLDKAEWPFLHTVVGKYSRR